MKLKFYLSVVRDKVPLYNRPEGWVMSMRTTSDWTSIKIYIMMMS